MLPLIIPPGIYRDATDYAAKGKWWDADKVRFINGLPEQIGGWQKFSSSAVLGIPRSSHAWSSNAGSRFFACGTHLKYYIFDGDSRVDVTPVRSTSTIDNNPFSVVDTLTSVTVADTSHGAGINDYVTFSGASAVGGVTISGEYQITSIIDANSYTITHSVAATSTATGGGASVTAAYQYQTGAVSLIFGTGWGAGAYGRETYGSASTSSTPGDQMRLWSEANYGEDLVFNPRGGPVYYWDASSPGSRGVDIGTLGGAAEPPVEALWVLVSDKDRRVLAFGVNQVGETSLDPMHIRWSSDGDPADWDPTDINSAGGRSLDAGREIFAAILAPGEILVYTDVALYALRENYSRTVYDLVMVSPKTDLAGPNAVVSAESATFWMGTSNFYVYNGQVGIIPCSIRDYVFTDINQSQRFKFHAAHNSKYSEVWFFYCSADSDEIDRYAIYNYTEQTWCIGQMARTTWHDRSVESNPRAVGADGYIYYHEVGITDGSTTPASAINSYIETGLIEVGEGDKFYLTRRVIPDINFRNSVVANPSVSLMFTAQNEPGSIGGNDKTVTVLATAAGNTESHSRRLGMRMRARALRMRLESTTSGVCWRSGEQRIDAVESGSK